MDDPGLAPAQHLQALRGLARINWISASDRILWKPLYQLARATPHRPLRVLDIATGGGDVPIRIWQRARRIGLNIDIHGADVSPTALHHAEQQAQAAGADVRFFRLDIHGDVVPMGFDVLTCSLFLHHLAEDQALTLLRGMRAAAGQMVLINDLRRAVLGYLLAWLGCRVLSRSSVVHTDGPISVAAAFTLNEVHALAQRAGMTDITLRKHWPFRYLLTWRRP